MSDEFAMLCPTCGGLPVDHGELVAARARIDQLAAALEEALDVAAMSLNHLDRNAEAKANRVSALHALLATPDVSALLAKRKRLAEAVADFDDLPAGKLPPLPFVLTLLAAAREVVG